MSTLNIPEQRGRPLTETLIDFLRPKTLLLVVDNCEHLFLACAELVRFFGAAEALRQSIESPLPDLDRGDYDRRVTALARRSG